MPPQIFLILNLYFLTIRIENLQPNGSLNLNQNSQDDLNKIKN
jgi:hypothetical protein